MSDTPRPTAPAAPARRAGFFVPLFALRTETDLGVGDTGGLRSMAAWCRQTGFHVLQILPINETGGDNSPYNAISSLALEPSTLEISPDLIPGLTRSDFERLAPASLVNGLRKGPVQYRKVKQLKLALLEAAFTSFQSVPDGPETTAFANFLEEEAGWLGDYALFRTLFERYGHPNWETWLPEHRSPALAQKWVESLPEADHARTGTRILFFSYVQWVLHRQWTRVRDDLRTMGVGLMGDIPFGVSRHSADVWADPGQFDLRWSGGAPPEEFFKPDRFTEIWGQNWGIPVYDWAAMEGDGFAWWKRRIRATTRFFDLFRIDHVLGFYRIYAFPWQPQENERYAAMTPAEVEKSVGQLPRFLPGDDSTETSRALNQAQGERLLRMVLDAAGDAVVVAEDLGVVPDYVRPSLQKMGISGFKIPVFERDPHSQEYLPPEEYPELTLATLSTHDHLPMEGFWEMWWERFSRPPKTGSAENQDPDEATRASWELYRTLRFARLPDHTLTRSFFPAVHEGVCRRLLDARSWLAVLMVTDALGLNLRFNVPGPVADSNWSERLPFTVSSIPTEWSHRLRDWIASSGRIP